MPGLGEGQYVEVDGIQTFFVKRGTGHPLVLIHGGAPGACIAVSWRPNIDVLASAGFTVYAFDQPGYGLTDNAADFSMEYRYRHAVAFLDKMGLDRFHMIANSQGAYLAARIGLADRRTRRLVFTASATLAPRGSAAAQSQAEQHGQELAGYEPSLENVRKMTMQTLYNKEMVDDDLVRTRYAMSIGKNYEAQQKRKDAQRPKPIADQLGNLTAKTLLLWGLNDKGVAVERGVLLLQALPDAELHVFNHCGHWPQWDQTARFHDVVRGFLRESAM